MVRLQFQTFVLIVLLVTMLVVPVEGLAGVVVSDRITTVGTPVFLKVLTKGKFFAEGGRRVQIRLGDQKPQMIMSGGDGFAYFKVQPKREGLFEIDAVENMDRDTGHLLVMKADATAVVIGVESSLRDSFFSDLSKRGGAKAVTRLAQHHRIIYVTEWLNAGAIKGWLEREEYPLSVVVRWRGGNTLAMLKKQRVSLAAVVGSTAMLKASRPEVKKRFCFEETRYGTTVSDWKEILNQLDVSEK
jgi:hypothetical protein